MNIPVHMDHIIPFSYTNHSSNDNWVLSCSKCNQQKSDKIFRDTSDVADFCYKMILDHGSLGEGWPEGSWDYWEFAPIEEDDMVGSPKGGAGTSNDG